MAWSWDVLGCTDDVPVQLGADTAHARSVFGDRGPFDAAPFLAEQSGCFREGRPTDRLSDHNNRPALLPIVS